MRYRASGDPEGCPRMDELAVVHSCARGLEAPWPRFPEKSPERPPKTEDEGEEAGMPTSVRKSEGRR